MEKVYVLEVRDFEGDEINTYAFETLEDFNKARNLISYLWDSEEYKNHTISEILEKNHINFSSCCFDYIIV